MSENLRHHAREHHVVVEDLCVAGQAGHALLDACAARVIDEDERRARLKRHLHHLDDLVAVDFAGRAARNGEILAGDLDDTAVHTAGAGDDPVGGRSLPAMPKSVAR